MGKTKSRRIRIAPKAFNTDWRKELKELGVHVPDRIATLSYTPVNHNPMPFSLEIDLGAMRVVRVIKGVMPNAVYQGHIYSWLEFCELINTDDAT